MCSDVELPRVSRHLDVSITGHGFVSKFSFDSNRPLPICHSGAAVGDQLLIVKCGQDVQLDLLRRNCHLPLYRIICTARLDRKSTRLNSSHITTSYAVFCLKKKTN